MKTTFRILVAVALLLFAASGRCVAQTNVTGVVVDRNGKPIEGAACMLAGTPSLTPDHRVIYSGIARPIFTDNGGRFSIPLPQSVPLVDLQFDSGGHAPVFLYRASPSDSPLRVVMTEGKVLRGRIVDEQQIPIVDAVIELQMPQEDRWYQRKEVTNTNGEFQFRISEPPEKSSWMLYYAGKRFQINYSQVTPKTSIILTVDVRMTSGAEPCGPANGSQPIRSETNRTSSAAGSRR
jgi:hypothetical protein